MGNRLASVAFLGSLRQAWLFLEPETQIDSLAKSIYTLQKEVHTGHWNPGYHQTSTAYVDDTALYVTRPGYDYAVYLPLVTR